MTKKIQKALPAIASAYLIFFMIAFPATCIAAAKKALDLCAQIVIPSLFPFIFCSNLLIAAGCARFLSKYLTKIMLPLFNITGSGSIALILGLTSGYPIGASCATSLYLNGECTKNEAERLIAFCNNSGPMFIIGSVGLGMLNNAKAGVFLYIIHIFSALLTGIILKAFTKKETPKALPNAKYAEKIKDAASDIGAAISNSVDTILKICGFVIIFSVLIKAIPDFKYKSFIIPIFEITNGLKEFLSTNLYPKCLPYVSAYLALSGISVFFQVKAISEPAGLSLKLYALGKLIQAVIAAALTEISIKITPQPNFIPTLCKAENHNFFRLNLYIVSLLLFITAVILLIRLYLKNGSESDFTMLKFGKRDIK